MPRTMLVIGSAPCLYDDVKRALELRPFAEGILVNGACAALDWPRHMLCGHEEKTNEFVLARQHAFPGQLLPRIHATFNKLTGVKTTEVRVEEARQRFPQVTDWWPATVHMGAGSAGKAIGIARQLGFDEVILSGCPMDGSGYFPGEGDGWNPAKPSAGGIKQSMNCLRIGDGGLARGYPKPGTGGREWMKVQDTRIVQGYREHFAKLSQTEFKGWVYSMSGFTREHVGSPRRKSKMSNPNATSGGWGQHNDRGRGTFEDSGFADTSDDPRTTTELPAGYSQMSVVGVSTEPQEDGRGGDATPYGSIPEQM